MLFKKYLLEFESLILYNLLVQYFGSAKPLAGNNVRQAREDEFPFIAGLIRRAQTFDVTRDTICTGSVISYKDVLTADHCLDNESLNGVKIIIGSINLSSNLIYYPAWWIAFDRWAEVEQIETSTYRNDLCIIRLTSIVWYEIIPGKISYKSYENLKEKRAVAVGWGTLSNGSFPGILHTAKVKILNKEDCEARVSAIGQEDLFVDKNIVCTRTRPYVLLMAGDSGGPLLYKNKIVAISTGTCPLPDVLLHPDKVNLHTILKEYKTFVRTIKNMN